MGSSSRSENKRQLFTTPNYTALLIEGGLLTAHLHRCAGPHSANGRRGKGDAGKGAAQRRGTAPVHQKRQRARCSTGRRAIRRGHLSRRDRAVAAGAQHAPIGARARTRFSAPHFPKWAALQRPLHPYSARTLRLSVLRAGHPREPRTRRHVRQEELRCALQARGSAGARCPRASPEHGSRVRYVVFFGFVPGSPRVFVAERNRNGSSNRLSSRVQSASSAASSDSTSTLRDTPSSSARSARWAAGAAARSSRAWTRTATSSPRGLASIQSRRARGRRAAKWS